MYRSCRARIHYDRYKPKSQQFFYLNDIIEKYNATRISESVLEEVYRACTKPPNRLRFIRETLIDGKSVQDLIREEAEKPKNQQDFKNLIQMLKSL